MKRAAFADTSFAATFKDTDAARTYDARHAARARKLGKLLARSLAGLGFESGRILDAGSAAGHTAMALAEAFGSATLVGLDLCEPLLELGRAHAEARGLARRLTFTKGDVQAMPFDDDSFDAVVSNDTLHVVSDPVAMIDECERVLAPGGILLVRCIRRCWLGCLDGVFRTAYTPAEVRELLQRSSLRPWRVRVGLISLLIEAGGRRAPSWPPGAAARARWCTIHDAALRDAGGRHEGAAAPTNGSEGPRERLRSSRGRGLAMATPTDRDVPPEERKFSFERLKAEVDDRLEAARLPRKGSWPMLAKSAATFGLWVLAYAGLLRFGPQSLPVAVAGVVLLALLTLTMELAVMHDASHRAISRSARVSRLLSMTLTWVGASSILWYHSHVRLHHGHTNIPGRDPDLETGGLFRFCPQQAWRPWHRWQCLYALPLYSLLALRWVWLDDLIDLVRNTYRLRGGAYLRLLCEVVVCRIFHVGLFLVLPYLVVGSVLPVVAFYLAHWLIVGAAMPIVFETAHVTGVQDFPPDRTRRGDWALRQVTTTADFSVHNRLLTWFIGGLNFQVEHHIFPTTCHLRYPLIQPIVKRYCEDHGVAYHEYPSFLRAVRAHFAHLRNLARRPE